MRTQSTDYWKLFKPKACNLKLKGASVNEVFEEIVETLVAAEQLPAELAESALGALRDREAAASTGVGRNVAIPHVRVEGLEQAVVSVGVHTEGVDWNALDGDLVNLVFIVLRPGEAGDQHDPARHLDMMRWISRLGRESDFRRFAVAAKTRTELVNLLKEMSAV